MATVTKLTKLLKVVDGRLEQDRTEELRTDVATIKTNMMKNDEELKGKVVLLIVS